MTAAEWLANELYEKFEMKGDGALFNDLLNQAKEMEKQQEKSYSEEEAIDLIQFLSMNEEFNGYCSVSKETAKHFLKQFKKK